MVEGEGMVSFPLLIEESDLLISIDRQSFQPELKGIFLSLLSGLRGDLEQYIERDKDFKRTLTPHLLLPGAPEVVELMASAANKAGVGPMAAVAGAVAELMVKESQEMARNIIVENGGDICFKTEHPITVGVFAGKSPLSGKLGLRLQAQDSGYGVCTSSATVGHALSFGATDAAIVISQSAALADAAASLLGNLVHREKDITPALEKVCSIKGVEGAVVVLDDRLGVMGDVGLVSL